MSDREQFVADNAASLVAELEAKVKRQAEELAKLNQSREALRAENERLKKWVDELEAAVMCEFCGRPNDETEPLPAWVVCNTCYNARSPAP